MHRGIETEDVAFINGCVVRQSGAEGIIEIYLSPRNYLRFSQDKDRLDIKDLSYIGREDLYILLEAFTRIGRYTRSDRFICDTNLPMEQIIVLDSTGIFDRIIDHL